MDKICIIVPVYNREATLERCVNSIINQTFTDWALLLVDDGSTDTSGQICDAFVEKDSRIQVLHKENGGVSSARNAGLDWAFANSQSSWLAFIDSDDWVCPTYFQRLIESALRYEVDISCCHYIEMEKDAIYHPEPGSSELMTTVAYWKDYPSPSVVSWGKIYRKTLFMDIRYPLGKICEDTFTTHKVLFQRNQIAWTAEKLYCYYISPDGISRDRNARLWSHWSEAYEEQATFFHAKELNYLRNIAVRRMLNFKTAAIEFAKNHHDMQTVTRLKNDLKRQIIWAHTELSIPLYGNEYIFETAMPFRARVSRKWRHFKRDIRKFLFPKK